MIQPFIPDEWPSHVEELTRKTTLAVQALVERYERGEIEAKELCTALGALWDTVSGLVDDDLSHMIAELHSDIRSQLP